MTFIVTLSLEMCYFITYVLNFNALMFFRKVSVRQCLKQTKRISYSLNMFFIKDKMFF